MACIHLLMWRHGGSVKGLIKAIDGLLVLADDNTVIAPGHGPVMNKNELVAYRTMLETISTNVENLIKAGKTKDEIIAAKPTREFDASMHEAIVSSDAFAAIVYESLKQ